MNILIPRTISLTLLVAQAPKIQALKLNPNDVIKNWYTDIGEFRLGLRCREGMAVFSSDKGDVFVPFEGKFPKK